ncbi:hypothetical protein [Spiroplasma sp. TIUS-1]|uniref:hypothetical protein n=1 Tax=Spiroplasma sp. TIUS-1 TaxID=216963 RepID=UPI0013A6A94B|nr:hypothetical protein [Spiroplasma sp. TIUS-1]
MTSISKSSGIVFLDLITLIIVSGSGLTINPKSKFFIISLISFLTLKVMITSPAYETVFFEVTLILKPESEFLFFKNSIFKSKSLKISSEILFVDLIALKIVSVSLSAK